MIAIGKVIRARSQNLGEFFGQDERPQEWPANMKYLELSRDEVPKSAGSPMVDVLRGVAKVAHVLKPHHIPNPPPWLVRNAGQEIAAGDSPGLAERRLGIPNVFKNFQHKHKVKGSLRKGQIVNIGCSDPRFRQSLMRKLGTFRIEVYASGG